MSFLQKCAEKITKKAATFHWEDAVTAMISTIITYLVVLLQTPSQQ
jgi:predicted GTPase